jgi:hypothetical protein
MLLVVACAMPGAPATPAPTSSPGGAGALAQDKAGLLTALGNAGVTVSSTGQVEQPFLSVPGEAFSAGGGTLQVFEYPDEAAARRDADKIKPDGTIEGYSIGWVDRPHFYRAGRMLVVFLGTDPTVLSALEAALGKPFAVYTGPLFPGGSGTPQP